MTAIPSHRKPALASLLLGVAAAGLALGAQAGESPGTRSAVTRVSVSYADLDLTDPAGAAVMYARLRTAARQACGPEPSLRALQQHAAFEACFDRALNKAVHRVDSERLHALHAARAGQSAVG